MNAVDLDGKDAHVEVSENEIIVSALIYIYGDQASSAEAQRIQNVISFVWNDVTQISVGGKPVSFSVSVEYRSDIKEDTRIEGINVMNVDMSTRSFVKGSSHGSFNYVSAPHEFGHMLGLADQYDKVTCIPYEGFEGALMAEPSGMGVLLPEEIQKVITLAGK